jgi:hypothetical protein
VTEGQIAGLVDVWENRDSRWDVDVVKLRDFRLRRAREVPAAIAEENANAAERRQNHVKISVAIDVAEACRLRSETLVRREMAGHNRKLAAAGAEKDDEVVHAANDEIGQAVVVQITGEHAVIGIDLEERGDAEGVEAVERAVAARSQNGDVGRCGSNAVGPDVGQDHEVVLAIAIDVGDVGTRTGSDGDRSRVVARCVSDVEAVARALHRRLRQICRSHHRAAYREEIGGM